MYNPESFNNDKMLRLPSQDNSDQALWAIFGRNEDLTPQTNGVVRAQANSLDLSQEEQTGHADTSTATDNLNKNADNYLQPGPSFLIASQLSSQTNKTTNSMTRYGARYVSAEAPISVKASVPSLPRVTYDRLCKEAALSCGLPSDALHPYEAKMLGEILETSSWLTKYVDIRNGLCYLWIRNPTLFISFTEALGIVREKDTFPLASLAFEFLTRNGYVNYGCLYIPFTVPYNETLPQKSVAVVGCGLAGLSCARQLANLFAQYEQDFVNRNENVPRLVVFEADSRIGGRILSHRLESSQTNADVEKTSSTDEEPTQHFIEIGADRILEMNNAMDPLRIVADQQLSLDVQIHETPLVKLISEDGSSVDPATIQRICELFDCVVFAVTLSNDKITLNGVLTPEEQSLRERLDFLQRFGYHLSLEHFRFSNEGSLGSTLKRALSILNDFIQFNDVELQVLNWCLNYLQQGVGANLDFVSTKCWSCHYQPICQLSNSMTIGEGMSSIVQHMASTPTPLPIQLNHSVVSVKYNDTGVQLISSNQQVINVDKVVLCLPLSVYKKHTLTFEPALPDWKVTSLNRVSTSNFRKVNLLFSHAFWDSEATVFGKVLGNSFNDIPMQSLIFFNYFKQTGLPLLITNYFASENESDSEISEKVMNALTDQFSHMQNFVRPKSVFISNWNTLPFSSGSLSVATSSFSAADYKALAAPLENTVFFASDSMSGESLGTLHSSFRSGLMAARDVLASLVGDVAIPQTLIVNQASKQTNTTTQSSNTSSTRRNTRSREQVTPKFSYRSEYIKAKQARLEKENQECQMLIQELLGAPPEMPSRPTANPFLLYQKTQWHVCKAMADKDRQEATGDPEARATKNEIRAKLGRSWRDLDESGKQPWIDEVNARRANYTALMEEYQRQLNTFNTRAAQIKAEHRRKCEAQPIPVEESRLQALAENEEEERARNEPPSTNSHMSNVYDESDDEYHDEGEDEDDDVADDLYSNGYL
ncbi:histone demethylase SWIRM1 [Schizosaccharomyces japonicus yFS275]|uniref:Histone demethylase SWIRM1 n=1 Tax=Schizosaccharomyces japonicus (strain yFS275 / FY16936) TaxID=402676 RepID=B6K5M1_SCHJY|nr:histone demethylase SWIRM1 [Schizosaccharomyces japonicus yFS275]EEB08825.2 histone demethylase SWIRM1 [Schizosaccharomyces japonicus yFS275]